MILNHDSFNVRWHSETYHLWKIPRHPKSSSHTWWGSVWKEPLKALPQEVFRGPNDIFSGGGPGCLGYVYVWGFKHRSSPGGWMSRGIKNFGSSTRLTNFLEGSAADFWTNFFSGTDSTELWGVFFFHQTDRFVKIKKNMSILFWMWWLDLFLMMDMLQSFFGVRIFEMSVFLVQIKRLFSVGFSRSGFFHHHFPVVWLVFFCLPIIR